jgi:hypothetical protein
MPRGSSERSGQPKVGAVGPCICKKADARAQEPRNAEPIASADYTAHTISCRPGGAVRRGTLVRVVAAVLYPCPNIALHVMHNPNA